VLAIRELRHMRSRRCHRSPYTHHDQSMNPCQSECLGKFQLRMQRRPNQVGTSTCHHLPREEYTDLFHIRQRNQEHFRSLILYILLRTGTTRPHRRYRGRCSYRDKARHCSPRRTTACCICRIHPCTHHSRILSYCTSSLCKLRRHSPRCIGTSAAGRIFHGQSSHPSSAVRSSLLHPSDRRTCTALVEAHRVVREADGMHHAHCTLQSL